MTEAELETLITSPEGDRLERCERMDFEGFKDKLLKTLCAFANDLNSLGPGTFLIGVRDDKAGGGLSGYRYRDEDEQQIVN